MLKGEIFLAWQYMKLQKSVTSILTYTCLLGPIIGVGILIVVIAVMNGIPREYEKKIVGYTAHIQIVNSQGQIKNYPQLIKHLEEKYQVKCSPVTMAPILLETKSGKSEVFLAKGILPELDRDVSQIHTMLLNTGKTTYELSENELILSTNSEKLLSVIIGDSVILHSPEKYKKALSEDQTAEEAINNKTMSVKVSQFYATGLPDIDDNIILLNQKMVNRLTLLPEDSCGQLEIKLKNPEDSIKVAEAMMSDPLLEKFYVTPWQEHSMVRYIKMLISSQKSLIVFVLFFIVVGAAIAVAACLFSVAIQKTREIGILKATGVKPTAIISTFLIMGTILGMLGSGLGTIGGLIALYYRQGLARFLGIWDVRLYKLDYVPAHYDVVDILSVFGISVLICTVATIVPAIIAASINPIKALQSKG